MAAFSSWRDQYLETLGQQVLAHPLALPPGKVAILQGKFGQCRLTLFGVSGVEGGQFREQHAPRPAVADNVVQRDQEQTFFAGNLE